VVALRPVLQRDGGGHVVVPPVTVDFSVRASLGSPVGASTLPLSNLIVRSNPAELLLEAFVLAKDPANPSGPSFVWHTKQQTAPGDTSIEKIPVWMQPWRKLVADPATDIAAFEVVPGADNRLNVVAIGRRAGVAGVFHARRVPTAADPLPDSAAAWNPLQPLPGVNLEGGITAVRIVGGVTSVLGRRVSVFVSSLQQTNAGPRRVVHNAIQTAADSATWDTWLSLPSFTAASGALALALDPSVTTFPRLFAAASDGHLFASSQLPSGFEPWRTLV
jgi:hypothetical protein